MYTIETLAAEYKKVHIRLKDKKELVSDAEVRAIINNHPFVYAILGGLQALKVYETTITRRNKNEALQAVADLEKRGYTISFPLTEKKTSNELRGVYDYRKNKYTSKETNVCSCWIVKMKKEVE